MKVAIYIENGVTQLVLTPETGWEEEVTRKMCGCEEGNMIATIHRGGFYYCQGGWYRHSGNDVGGKESLIMQVREANCEQSQNITS